MNIFVAGPSGAIGRPLIAELIRRGHVVTGLARSESGAQYLNELGASAAIADAFDQASLEAALRRAGVEVVIDELTSLPKDPAQMPGAASGDRRLRLEGGGNLLRAAKDAGVRRYIQQASGFFLKASGGLADESSPLATDASPGVAASARAYAELEERLSHFGEMEGVALRYGFFHGPGTWYHRESIIAEKVRRQEMPVIGNGGGVWSFVHVEDAALATAAAVDAQPGTYNIVDDDPSPVAVWLPAFARWIGAPPPPVVPESEARERFGEDAVYYGTRLCGASNGKAKSILGFQPRRLEWIGQPCIRENP